MNHVSCFGLNICPLYIFFGPLTPPGAREGEVSHVLVREDDGSAGW